LWSYVSPKSGGSLEFVSGLVRNFTSRSLIIVDSWGLIGFLGVGRGSKCVWKDCDKLWLRVQTGITFYFMGVCQSAGACGSPSVLSTQVYVVKGSFRWYEQSNIKQDPGRVYPFSASTGIADC